MAELAASEVQIASSVEGDSSPSLRKPGINEKKFAKIIRILYTALIHRQGIYGQVSMETHAPQLKYYPGAPALIETKPQEKQTEEITSFPSLKEVEKMYNDFKWRLFAELPTVVQGDISGFEVTQGRLAPADSKQLRALQRLMRAANDREENKIGNEVFKPTKDLPRGTLEHRRWLWFATLTDRREKSDLVYRAHCRIYEDYPELYDRRGIGMHPDEFRERIRKRSYKIGSPYQSAEYWLVCLKTLFEEFDGDPVNLLKVAGWSVRGVYAWKQEERRKRGHDPIPGWGRKLISLYFLYLAELGFPMPDDVFPADIHAQAILVQTGCLDFAGKDKVYTAAIAEMIRQIVTKICNSKGYDVILYGHASWLLGSQLCVNCAGNNEIPLACPIYKQCKGRVDTSPYFAKGIWRKDGQVMVKGGIRPKFGLPTDVRKRERTRKATQPIIPIAPLFD